MCRPTLKRCARLAGYLAVASGLLVHLAGCQDATNSQSRLSWQWNLPEGIPAPKVPADNPMSQAKVDLGRRLFYDKRLSDNQTQSCASCHQQKLAFTDGRARAKGSTGQVLPRGSMSLTNAAYNATLTWANPLTRRLEKQMLTPMFNDDPAELGLPNSEVLLERLRADSAYPDQFQQAFPDTVDPVSLDHVTKALASFERTLISVDSPYDRYVYGGQEDALTASQKRGMQLFNSERLECFHCHGGFNFSDSLDHSGKVIDERPFHNNGLYNVGGDGSYPAGNQGVYEITGDPADRGRFRAPTLRNIALTAPYMHDGSIATLRDVIAHYARGGRKIEQGPNAGDGHDNPNKSELLTGFQISEQETEDVVHFLQALTDQNFVHNPKFADPADE